MSHDEQWVALERIKLAACAAAATCPPDYVFETALIMVKPNGAHATSFFDHAFENEVDEWAVKEVRTNLAVEAYLSHSVWMPGRLDSDFPHDFAGFERYLEAGGEAHEWPGSVEVMNFAILRPGERPCAVLGYLHRGASPVSIEWAPDVIYPRIPTFDSICDALEEVQLVLGVIEKALAEAVS